MCISIINISQFIFNSDTLIECSVINFSSNITTGFRYGENEFSWTGGEIIITIVCDIYNVITSSKLIISNFKNTLFINKTGSGIIINIIKCFFTCNVNNDISIRNMSISIINISQSILNNNTLIESSIININSYITASFRNNKIKFTEVTDEILITHVSNVHSVISCSKLIIIDS